MSSFEVCHHELKSSMVCVIFCSPSHFVGEGQVKREIQLVMCLFIKYMKQGRGEQGEKLPQNACNDGLRMLSWDRGRREGAIVCLDSS